MTHGPEVKRGCDDARVAGIGSGLIPTSRWGSTTKRIFAFHNFVEKFIGLFGRVAVAPPPNADSIEQKPGETRDDDDRFLAHGGSLVQRTHRSKGLRPGRTLPSADV